jgi:signal transduction histidine kinase
MQFYQVLSKVGFLRKSYMLKFLFVAFIGIHIPLIGIVLYVGVYAPQSISSSELLLLTLVFTLLATGGTLFVLNKLLQPVQLAKKALLDYQEQHIIPDLPLEFIDEVGVLLHSIQTTIDSLEAVNKTKSELMYTITHDLRNPLAQIISLTGLMNKEQGELKQLIDMIRTSAEQELRFIDNYMLVIETADYKIEDQTTIEVNITSIVDHVLEMMKPQLALKGLSVETSISPLAKIKTTKDLLFERVARNLVSNAIKFTPSGGKISILAEVTQDQTMLTVSDSGIGLDPTNTEGIFDKFTTHKRNGTEGEPTNGIGLYLTREIVKKHNGTITAYSEGGGKGTTFEVCW